MRLQASKVAERIIRDRFIQITRQSLIHAHERIAGAMCSEFFYLFSRRSRTQRLSKQKM